MPIVPYHEPWYRTALRTGGLAVAVGAVAALIARRPAVLAVMTLVALWFTLGGHVVEILYRNRLARWIAGSAALRFASRLIYWFAGGALLYLGASWTRALVGVGPLPWPWWSGGALFIAIELVAHLLLRARGQPSVYDGRG